MTHLLEKKKQKETTKMNSSVTDIWCSSYEPYFYLKNKTENWAGVCSDEIAAVLKLDNVEVARTSWRGCSQQAWDQRFSIQLEKSRQDHPSLVLFYVLTQSTNQTLKFFSWIAMVLHWDRKWIVLVNLIVKKLSGKFSNRPKRIIQLIFNLLGDFLINTSTYEW